MGVTVNKAPHGERSKDNHTTGLCVGTPFDNLPATRGNGVMVALNAVSVEMIRESL